MSQLDQLRGELMYLVAVLESCGTSREAAEQYGWEAAKDPNATIDRVIARLGVLREELKLTTVGDALETVS